MAAFRQGFGCYRTNFVLLIAGDVRTLSGRSGWRTTRFLRNGGGALQRSPLPLQEAWRKRNGNRGVNLATENWRYGGNPEMKDHLAWRHDHGTESGAAAS